MRIWLCIDDTDDVSKKTSTGALAQLIANELKAKGGTMVDGISRHQLLLHRDIKYTSHNSSMCMVMDVDDISAQEIQRCAEKNIAENMAETADPGLAICIADKIRDPERLIEFGFSAKERVLTKKDAYTAAALAGGMILSELGGDGSGVIGAVAGVGLRMSRRDGTFRGKMGTKLRGIKMTPAEMRGSLKVEQIIGLDGREIPEDSPVMIENFAKPALVGGKVSVIAKRNEAGLYLISPMNDDEALVNRRGNMKRCAEYCRDNDEEECRSGPAETCFNCLYRKWTQHGFQCMKYMVCFLLIFALLCMPVNCTAVTGDAETKTIAYSDSAAETDEEPGLDIVIRVGNDIVSELTVSLEDLQKLPQTRQAYTTVAGDGTPELTLAEGVQLSVLLEYLEIKMEDFASIRVFSEDGSDRSFIYNFLYGIDRYTYSNLVPAWMTAHGLETEEPADEKDADAPEATVSPEGLPGDESEPMPEATASPEELPEDESEPMPEAAVSPEGLPGDESEPMPEATASPEELPEDESAETDPAEGEAKVMPMLAIWTYCEQLAVSEDWSKLNQDAGFTFCYGQMTPGDKRTLSESHINKIELMLDADSLFGKTEAEIQAIENRASVNGLYNFNDNITGPVTDSATGKSIDELPDTITINAGYFGNEFEEVRVFTIDEIKALPVIWQAYTMLGEDSSVISAAAVGVRLTDLMAAAGVDVNAVANFYFYTADDPETAKANLTKSFLIDTPKYCYPRLARCWDSTSGTLSGGAAAGAVAVDTIIAFRDYWGASATVPDFYNVDVNGRFRLIFGQTGTMAKTASQCVGWIYRIDVLLEGSPPKKQRGNIVSGMNTGDSSGASPEPETAAAETGKTEAAVQSLDAGENAGVKIYTLYEMQDNSNDSWNAEQALKTNPWVWYIFLALFALGLFNEIVVYRRGIGEI